MPAQIGADRPDDRTACGGERGGGDGVAREARKFGLGLRSDADVFGAESGRRGSRGKGGAAPGARGDAVGLGLVLDHRLAQHARLGATIFGGVGAVIGGDFGLAGGHRRDIVGADPRDVEHALFGHHVALLVLRIIGLKIAVRRIEPGNKLAGRDQRQLALALLEQHRRIGPRHADRHARIDRRRRQYQPLGDRHVEQPAHIGVGHLLLAQEALIGDLAELPVEPAGLRHAGDFAVDQLFRHDEAMVGGERHQRALVDHLVKDHPELPRQRGIGRLGILGLRLLERAVHRRAQVAIGDILVADIDQRATAATQRVGSDVADVGQRERRQDREQEHDQDDGPDPGLGQAAEKGNHGAVNLGC